MGCGMAQQVNSLAGKSNDLSLIPGIVYGKLNSNSVLTPWHVPTATTDKCKKIFK